MRRKQQKIRKLMSMALAFAVSMVVVTTAWAALSLVDFQSDLKEFKPSAQSETLTSAAKEKARAPEPSTLVLFGSGILGMVLSFVRKTYIVAKRAIDIFLASVAIVLLSPLFLFAAVLIKLTSRGPVIFTQTRMGKDGQLFQIYKFRTMKVDAEKETGPVWASMDDPRLIPGGEFLRKTHIDEIPQFFNVLKGEMSVIGPRPERPEFVAKLRTQICDYEKRLTVKPGITGLAQVWHRYDETLADVRKKIKYDVLYIKRLCLWTDLQILFRTVRVVFTGEGAR